MHKIINIKMKIYRNASALSVLLHAVKFSSLKQDKELLASSVFNSTVMVLISSMLTLSGKLETYKIYSYLKEIYL